MGTAHAQTALYECCPNCQAAATGLRVDTVLLNPVSLGVATGPTQTCAVAATVGSVASTGVACGAANSEQCSASGELVGSNSDPNAFTTIDIPGLVAIRAQVLRGEVRCGPNGLEGSSTIVGLTINGSPVSLASNCQLTISLLGVTITVNEQTCRNGRLTVRALHVEALNVADVVVGEAVAGAAGCRCVEAPAC